MAIKTERLHEFMRLYEAEFGEPIDEDGAREMASMLVELYRLLAAPLLSERARAKGEDPTPEPGPTGRVEL